MMDTAFISRGNNFRKKILVTGATGLAGSAIVRGLVEKGYMNIIATYHTKLPENSFYPDYLTNRYLKFIKIDLLNQEQVKSLFNLERPDYVFLAAARVGGIMANHNHRAEFIYENLQIQNNIIHSSYCVNVEKLIFLGSTCIYPKNAPQPMKESYLMTDTLEYLSEPYGVAKISGIKMCESYNIQYHTNYIAVMPTNLYGLNDNYNLENSHFLPAFLRKMHLAESLRKNDWDSIRNDMDRNPHNNIDGSASEEKIVELLNKYGIVKNNDNEVTLTLWGTGKPRREILHSDELADACVYIMENINFSDLIKSSQQIYSSGIVKEEIRNTQLNIGLGFDFTLKEIALKVKQIVGFTGILKWDEEMPDGTPQKLTDVSRLTGLGWKSKKSLEEGIKDTYNFYKSHTNSKGLMSKGNLA